MKFKTVYKINTFVPPEHADALFKGILKLAPLAYGNYDQVAWFSSAGVEQYRPGTGSRPTLGREHVVERTSSVNLEFTILCEEELLQRVLVEGIAAHHPWEEPVIYVSRSLSTRTECDEDDF